MLKYYSFVQPYKMNNFTKGEYSLSDHCKIFSFLKSFAGHSLKNIQKKPIHKVFLYLQLLSVYFHKTFTRIGKNFLNVHRNFLNAYKTFMSISKTFMRTHKSVCILIKLLRTSVKFILVHFSRYAYPENFYGYPLNAFFLIL